MSEPPPPTTGRSKSAIAAWVIAVPSLLVWMMVAGVSFNPGGGDAAGDAIAHGLSTLALAVLWAGVGCLTLLTAVRGRLPPYGQVGLWILAVGGCLADFATLDLLYDRYHPPGPWCAIVVSAIPPILILLAPWAFCAPIRTRLPDRFVLPAAFNLLALLCLGAIALQAETSNAAEQEAARRRAFDQRLATFGPHTPLARWLDMIEEAGLNAEESEKVIAGIRGLARRQTDAEAMLDRDRFPIRDLWRYDLQVTPVFCEKARASLRRMAATVPETGPGGVSYDDISGRVDAAASAIEWLARHDCDASDAARAWARAMGPTPPGQEGRDPRYNAPERFRIQTLTDPAEVRRIADNNPASAALLNPRSHLRAWLRFLSDATLHDQILAGARALDHRTADLVEILNDPMEAGMKDWDVSLIPDLNPDATPALCASALVVIDQQMPLLVIPPRDEPRPVRDLMWGAGGRILPALIWLAAHGCDTGDRIADAEEIVSGYQESPDRAALLARLTAVKR